MGKIKVIDGQKILTKKDFPKWFSNYSEPLCSNEPEEFYKVEETLLSLDLESYVRTEIPKIPKDAEFIMVDSCHDGGCTIKFVKMVKKKNTYYKKELKRYKKEHEKCLEKIKDWAHWKKIWDDNEKKKQEDNDQRMYEKLKKKYDKENR